MKFGFVNAAVLLVLLVFLTAGCGKTTREIIAGEGSILTENAEGDLMSSYADGGFSRSKDNSSGSVKNPSNDSTGAGNIAGNATGNGNTEGTDEDKDTGSGSSGDDEDVKGDSGATIFVYVCGEVISPGVYELPEGSRIYEAVAAAGGMKEGADPDFINQAAVLEDGEKLKIYSLDETSSMEETLDGTTAGTGSSGSGNTGNSGAGNTGSGKTSKINLNTADESTLMTLPGIGEAKAKAIISFRKESGGFETIEDIMKVSGIKNSVFDKIKDLVTVNQE